MFHLDRHRARAALFVTVATTLAASAVGVLGSLPATAASTQGGVVSFTFDDGRISQFTSARPLLQAAGVKATFYIISDALTWGSTNMNATQVRAMAADGHEIGNHTKTHTNLTKLSSAQVQAEFSQSQTAIATATGVAPRSCAYPYGASNATVQSLASRYFTSCRGTTGGQNTLTGNRYDLRTYYVQTSTTAAQIRAAADQARVANTWLVLIYHGVGTISSSDDVSTTTLTAHLNAVKASGVAIRTVSGVLEDSAPPTPTPTPTPTITPTPTPTVTPTPTPTVTPTQGVVSFAFDDGKIGQYTTARPVLNAAGLRGTFFVISDALTWGSTNMNATQVREMAADGHEIGNHTKTHSNLTGMSAAQVDSEFSQSQAALTAASGTTPRACAYPYGASNATVESVAAKYFTGCRGTNGGLNTSGTNRYRLVTYYVHTSTTAADVRAAVDQARSTGAWLILTYHGVGTVGSSDDVTAATFSAHVDAVKASGVTVRTVGQALG
jgi:peptidoglycan/xylan/chitin deacetylase (PgdA/CDA1 family)